MPIDVSKTVAALDVLAARFKEAARSATGDGAYAIRDGARELAPLGIGTLRASIIVDGPRQASSVPGLVASLPHGDAVYAAKIGPTVVYGRIREIGGRIPGRRKAMIHPYLRWQHDGHWVFRRSVYQHGTGYLRHATEMVVPRVNGFVRDRLTTAIRSI